MPVAVNRQTGERLILIGGRWMPMGAPQPQTAFDDGPSFGETFRSAFSEAAGPQTAESLGGAARATGILSGNREAGEAVGSRLDAFADYIRPEGPGGFMPQGVADVVRNPAQSFAALSGMGAGSMVLPAAAAAAGAATGSGLGPAGTAIGGAIGALGSSYALNFGENYNTFVELGANDEQAARWAAGLAAPQGVLDSVGLGRVLRPFRGAGLKFLIDAGESIPSNVFARIAKGAGISGAAEATTEMAQAGIQEAGAAAIAPEYTSEGLADRLAINALGGLAAGAPLGAVTGGFSRPTALPADIQEERQAPRQAEQSEPVDAFDDLPAPPAWQPIYADPDDEASPVTGYVNPTTSEIRTPEEHLAAIQTPLSGLEPRVPDPAEIRQAARERDETTPTMPGRAQFAPGEQPKPAPATPLVGPSGTVPEPPEQIAAQTKAYAAGQRGPVFVDGAADRVPVPDGMVAFPSRFGGSYIVRPEEAAQIRAIEATTIDKEAARARILGYQQTKDEALAGRPVAVQAKDAEGNVVAEELVDADNPEALAAASESKRQMAEDIGGLFTIVPPDEAIRARQQETQTASVTDAFTPDLGALPADMTKRPPVQSLRPGIMGPERAPEKAPDMRPEPGVSGTSPPAPPQDARKPEPAPAAKEEAEAAPAASAGGDGAPVFAEQDIRVGKVTHGKFRSEVTVDAPLSVTDPENWSRIPRTDRLKVTVSALRPMKGMKATGVPKKRDKVWQVWPSGQKRPLAGSPDTYDGAVASAKDYVLSALRGDASAPSVDKTAPSSDPVAQPAQPSAAPADFESVLRQTKVTSNRAAKAPDGNVYRIKYQPGDRIGGKPGTFVAMRMPRERGALPHYFRPERGSTWTEDQAVARVLDEFGAKPTQSRPVIPKAAKIGDTVDLMPLLEFDLARDKPKDVLAWAEKWVRKVGSRRGGTRSEMAVEVVAVFDGDKPVWSGTIDNSRAAPLDRDAMGGRTGLTAVHNHPKNGPPSALDITQLFHGPFDRMVVVLQKSGEAWHAERGIDLPFGDETAKMIHQAFGDSDAALKKVGQPHINDGRVQLADMIQADAFWAMDVAEGSGVIRLLKKPKRDIPKAVDHLTKELVDAGITAIRYALPDRPAGDVRAAPEVAAAPRPASEDAADRGGQAGDRGGGEASAKASVEVSPADRDWIYKSLSRHPKNLPLVDGSEDGFVYWSPNRPMSALTHPLAGEILTDKLLWGDPGHYLMARDALSPKEMREFELVPMYGKAQVKALLDVYPDPSAIELVSEDGRRVALVSPDTVGDLGWRVTWFDKNGPIGHIEVRSLEEGITEALRSGYVRPEPGIVDAMSDGFDEVPPANTSNSNAGIRPIRTDTAVTSRGREIPVEYAVIEAADLVASQTDDLADNPAYPQWLQPRDRSRASSRQQITEMAANLNPRLLGETPNAGQGAPIVGADGFVESGNGRVLAIKRAYQGGKADAYRQYLEQQGYPVDGMAAPVLVRINRAEMSQQERAAFAREANERDTLSMGAGERAMADAAAISDATLELYRGGAVDLAANRPFVRALLEEAVGANERAGMIRSDGSMAQDAIRRIEAALLAKAYGDPDLVASLVEDSDSDIKAIGGALTDVAAAWSKMRSEAGSEAIDPAMDQTAALLEAVKLVQNARRQGRNVAEFVGQTDMFSGTAISPMARGFLGLMFRNRKQWTQPTGRGALGAKLRFYVDEAMKTAPGVDLLGLPPVKADDILSLLEGKNDGRPDDQGNLLAQPARRPGEGERGDGPSGEAQPDEVSGSGRGEAAAGSGGEGAAAEEDFDSIFDDALNEQFGQETDGAPTASQGLEPDSGGAAASDGVGGTDVPPRRGRARRGARGGAQAAGSGQGAAAGDQLVPGDGPPSVGEGGDPGVRAEEPAPAGEPAGDTDAGGGRKGGRNRPAARRGRKPRAGDAAPTVTESAASAAKNVVMGLDDVTRGLSEIFGGGKTIGSGLAFDEDTYRKAVPFFRAGVAHFAEAGANIADMVRALVRHLAGAGMDRAAVERMRPYVQRFVEDVLSGELDPAADATRQQAVDEARGREADRATKLEAQRAAEKVEVRVGDLDNIRATLPFLQPAQQEDVHKAESRLSQPDNHGFMFTNGTGTGKTYVGLGVIKRYARQGKGNVLVVAPSQPILQDWKTAAEDLGLEVSVLESTTDTGKGIVATTYANLGENRHLVDRKWDLVVADESHKLSSAQDGSETDALRTLRAITNHPRGRYVRADQILRDEIDEIAALNKQIKALNKSDDERDWRQAGPLQAKLDRALAAYKDRRDALLEQFRGEPRADVTFLSATPFAYDLNVDYGEGYLFDYDKVEGRGYNQPDGRGAFFMQHFGYRMRTGNLTQPEASVNSDVLEREFHEHLKREGSLSGRSLEVEADYERKFVLVEDAIGQKIDEALTFLGEADKGKFRPLLDLVNEKFDYLARMRLLEAIKARRSIPRIRKHLALGRKVVVFHDYNEGGGINPFVLAPPDKKPGDKADLKALYEEFLQRNPYALTLKFADNRSPIDEITRAFPDAMVYNGTVTPRRRSEIKRQFNEDGSGKDIIIVQSAAGEAGISLHDTTGKHQRVLMNLGMPVRPVTALQEEGRIYRVGQVTNAVFEYLNTGTNWERWTFAQRIAARSSTAENLALGNQARTIRQSFIDAFQESSSSDPAAEDGAGGKERDRATNDPISAFERAKTFYYAQGKRSGRRDQREGIDYFATPEPIALKMVEFADIKFGEKVLEPSAGHGAIARFFPEGSIRTVVEPSAELASRAALAAPGARMVTGRFEDLDVGANKFDAIVMNPPFGAGGKTAVDHLAKAAKHLRNGGRIVAIIPTGPAADKRFDAFMDDEERSKNVYMVADMAMPGVMFERAGTSVRTRIVVLEKQTDADVSPPPQASRDYSNAETVAELFDRIEGAGLASRSKPSTTEIDVPEDGSVNAGGIEFKLRTNETGQRPFWAEPGKIGRGRFFDVARASERAGGLYDRFDRAFQFQTAEARLQFLQALENPGTQAQGGAAAASSGGEQFDLAETKHSKTGKDLFVASIRDRVERERYTEINAVAKKHGGYYSAFRGKGAVPGFQFPSAEQRAAFVDEIAGGTPRVTAVVNGRDLPRFSLRQPVTDTPEFKRWFGDSKVVDGNGEPLVVYHGTNADFDAFETGINRRGDRSTLNVDTGIYFARDRLLAGRYAGRDGGSVYPAYLRIENPMPFEVENGGNKRGEGGYKRDALFPGGFTGSREDVQKAIDAGYDGIIRGDEIIVFSPEQIKSAFNRGTFDPADPRISYRLTDSAAAKLPALERDLRARMEKLGIADKVALRVVDAIRQSVGDGRTVQANAMWLRGAITVALEQADALGSLNHEVIHALRELGMFTGAEWKALERAASADTDFLARVRRSYDGLGLTEPQIVEEVIAEHYRMWADGRSQAGGWMKTAFGKVRRFFQALGQALRGQGFTTADAVFERVETGEVGGRGERDVAQPSDLWAAVGTGLTIAGAAAKYGMFGSFQLAGLAPGHQFAARDSLRDTLHALDEQTYSLIQNVLKPESRGRIGHMLDKARFYMQDRMIFVRRAQEAVERNLGRPLRESERAYLQDELLAGRVGEQKFRVQKDFQEPILERMHEAGLTLPEVDDYLYALHAEERNQQIASINPDMPDGGSGITTADARKHLRSVPAEKRPALEEIAGLVHDMMERRLDTLVETGVLAPKQAEAMRATYEHYVPLRGKKADPDEDVVELLRPHTGRGYMGSRRLEKRATGRFSEAPDILGTAFVLADEAIVRGEKNRVGQSILRLATAAPDPNVWKVNPAQNKAYIDKATGQVRYKRQTHYSSEDTMSVRVAGQEYRIQIKDPALLSSIKQIGGTQQNAMVEQIAQVTQVLSRLNTMWNPEFVVANASRDIQTALINLGMQADAGGIRKDVVKSWIPAYRGVHRYITTGKADTEWSKHAREFREAGGQTSFNALTDVESQKKTLENALGELRGDNRRQAMRALHKLRGIVEPMNDAVDNAVRLGTFVALRNRGVSAARAASIAKNLTVNFNRRGALGPTFNAFFMFFNAAMQGTAVLANAMRSPQVRKLVGAIAIAGAMQEIIAGLMPPPDDDDEEGFGLNAYDRIPEWVKERNLIIPYGIGAGEYLQIPMPYGYNWFHNLGRLTVAYLRGAPTVEGAPVSLGQTVARMGSSFAAAMIPPGLGDGVIPGVPVPSAVAPFVEVAVNQDWTGRQVMPERFPGDTRPDSQVYFNNVSPISREVADFLNNITGGNAFRSGMVDVSPESIDHVVAGFTGAAGAQALRAVSSVSRGAREALGWNEQDPNLSILDVPFVRKVVGYDSPHFVREVTYRRIAEVETLKDEFDLAREQGERPERQPLLGLAPMARQLRRQLSEIRKQRQAVSERDDWPVGRKREQMDRLAQRERELMTAFNRRYLKVLD